jgi:hypothetical protein
LVVPEPADLSEVRRFFNVIRTSDINNELQIDVRETELTELPVSRGVFAIRSPACPGDNLLRLDHDPDAVIRTVSPLGK